MMLTAHYMRSKVSVLDSKGGASGIVADNSGGGLVANGEFEQGDRLDVWHGQIGGFRRGLEHDSLRVLNGEAVLNDEEVRVGIPVVGLTGLLFLREV